MRVCENEWVVSWFVLHVLLLTLQNFSSISRFFLASFSSPSLFSMVPVHSCFVPFSFFWRRRCIVYTDLILDARM